MKNFSRILAALLLCISVSTIVIIAFDPGDTDTKTVKLLVTYGKESDELWTATENRLGEIEASIDSETLKTITDQATILKRDIDWVAGAMSTFQNRFMRENFQFSDEVKRSYENELNGMNVAVNNVQERLGTIETKIDGTKQLMLSLKEDIVSVKSNLVDFNLKSKDILQNVNDGKSKTSSDPWLIFTSITTTILGFFIAWRKDQREGKELRLKVEELKLKMIELSEK